MYYLMTMLQKNVIPAPSATPPSAPPRNAVTAKYIRDAELGVFHFLGEGTYGSVYESKLGGASVAVKVFRPEKKQDGSKEAQLLRNNQPHANIIAYHGEVIAPAYTALVMEYMPNGSLEQYLGEHHVNEEQMVSFLKQILSALVFLHGNKVIHGDVKTDNLLLDRSLTLKLSDFGHSLQIDENSDYAQTDRMLGSPLYTGPEAFEVNQQGLRQYTTQFDMHAYGVIMWLFQMHLSYDMRKCNTEKYAPAPECPPETSATTATLIRQCMSKDPKTRPYAKTVRDQLDSNESSYYRCNA